LGVRVELWCGQAWVGFFDDFGGRSGVAAVGELFGGEELGVAVVAVAGAEEVDEALLGDGNGFWCGWVRWRSGVCGCGRRSPSGFFGSLRSLRMTTFVGVGGRALAGRGFEGSHGNLEAVDHLAGAAGVYGVFGEAVDDGGEGDEDAGAVLDGRNLHAGDFGIDEDAVALFVGGADEVVVAVVLAFDGG
jgi:hypothetical protein